MAGEGIEVAKAFVTILPAMPGMQKQISSMFNGAGEAADKAGKDAGKQFSGSFTGGLKTVTGGIRSLAGMAAGALAGIGFVDIAKGAVEASDATKKFGNTLKFAGKSNEDIQRLTASTQKYADQTVYDLSDIQNVTAQLAANGVKDYDKLAEASGNLNAAAGGNKDTFKSVAMVMTQTAGAGKLTTENWNQLADAIPGASGLLQDAMRKNGAYTGNFRDAMEKGQISAEEFNQAIMQLGMNDGAIKAAKTTDTFEGAWGNLQASVQKAAVEIVNTAMPAITGALNWGSERITAFADWFAKAWQGITDLVDSGSVSKELQDAFNIPDTAIGPITDTVWRVRNLWQGLIDFVKTGDFTQQFNNAFLGVDQDTVNSIKDSMTGIRDTAKEFIDSLPKLKENLDKAKPSVDSFGASLKIFADTLAILKPVVEIIGKTGTAFNNLPAPIQTALIYVGLFGLGIGKILKPVGRLVKAVGGVGKAIGNAFKAVKGAPATVGNAVKNIGGKLNDAKAFIQLLPDYVKDFAAKIKGVKLPGWLSKLGGLLKKGFGKLGGVFDDLVKAGGQAVQKLGKVFGRLGGLISNAFKTGFGKVTGLVDDVIGKLKGIKLPAGLSKQLGNLKGGGAALGIAGYGIGEALNWTDQSKTTGQKLTGTVQNALEQSAPGMAVSGLMNATGLDDQLAGLFDSSGVSATADQAVSVIKQKFSELVAWFQQLPGQIGNTFSQIPTVVGGWFQQAVQFVETTWSNVTAWFTGVGQQIGATFSQIPVVVGGWFQSAVQSVQSLWSGVTAWFTGIAQQIGATFSQIPTVVGGWFQSAWVFIQGVWAGVAGWFTGVAQQVGNAFSQIPTVLSGWFQQAWNFIQSIWNQVAGWFRGVAQAVGDAFNNIPGRIGGLFQAAWNWVSGIWNGVAGWFQSNVWNPIQTGLNGIGSAFQSTKDWISRSWDAVKEAAADPVRFVVNTVYNDKLRGTWNGIADKLGLDLKLPEAHFARGGVMPGYTPGRDVMMAAVSGGEAIMRPEFTRAMGRDWIDRMNRLARSGGVKAVRAAALPHYADGGIIGTVKKVAQKVEDTVVAFMSDPAGFITSKIVNPVKDQVAHLSGGAWGQMIGRLPVKAAEALIDKAKTLFTGGGSNSGGAGVGGGPIVGYNAGAGVRQWTPQVLQALAMLGQPATWLDTVLRRMNQESGGNPNAINNWDINAKNGVPSQGLMQTIPPTFAAYAGPLRDRGILDPLANIYAGLNYALHRYGSLAALNRPGGYALGGIVPMLAQGGTVTQPGTVMVGEKGPELLRLPQGAQVRPLEHDMDRDDARIVDAINDFRDLLLPLLRQGFDNGQLSERDFARLVRRYA